MIAYADGHKVAANALVGRLEELILNPLIILLTAIALLVFLWGVFQYVSNASSGEAREEGRKHIIWGIVGLLIMLSAYAILQIALNTFGI